MLRRAFLVSLGLLCCAQLRAQTPSPAPPAPSPTPSSEAVINAMTAADLQQAIQLLKSNYIDPDALNETELNRALLTGLVQRLGRGVMILAQKPNESNEATAPFFGELLEGHIGYARFGALTPANLKALDNQLHAFREKKADALIVDLRASSGPAEFAVAADFAKRFVAKGKPLFSLRKPGSKQERAFTADADPAYQGVMFVLADGDTSGPAEAIAGVLRAHDKALIIGAATAGQAVEYSDVPLNGGRILRVAVAEAVLPEGRDLFPGGLKPDLPVDMPAADKHVVFQQSAEKGMSPFIFESERPHLDEAALLAGRNPELEAAEAAQRRKAAAEKVTVRDPVLQRAVDVVTSLTIYQQR